ncbi:MAG TPA: citramalate synthase [Candidatus Omnitrophota bacterium]|nr:citramalate synthase [Candidatus Omnitrophota bacterium]
MARKVYIYDTTLRDGAQSEGISFSVHDKMRVVSKLDELGVDFIEAGWPGINPKEDEFFKELRKNLKLKKSNITAFGCTRRVDKKPANDPVLNGLLKSEMKYITIFGKSWDLHVKEVLKTSLHENLALITDSIKYLKAHGRSVMFDAEHFFDGFEGNPEYAINTLKAAVDGGAEFVVLCDTNGGSVTSRVFEVVEEVRKSVKIPLGIHTHNDGEMAVANSIAAVQAGCTQVQGTFNGYGERCGNANLVSIAPALRYKLGYDCLSDFALKEFTEASRYIAEIANMRHSDNQPYVGSSAFTHKAGVHINAMIKNPKTYEHMSPEKIGNKRRMLVSEIAGRSSVLAKAEEFGLSIKKDTDGAKEILSKVQEMENEGYQFELAEASLMLLMRRAAETYKRHFELEDLRVIVEKRGEKEVICEATVKIKIGNEMRHTVSLGDGPVHAMDQALRKSLLEFYPSLSEMNLSDFSVRVLDQKAGTAAKVRVLVESQDEKESWWTVGVSENIIEASWKAIIDSIEYKFTKDELKKTKSKKKK